MYRSFHKIIEGREKNAKNTKNRNRSFVFVRIAFVKIRFRRNKVICEIEKKIILFVKSIESDVIIMYSRDYQVSY